MNKSPARFIQLWGSLPERRAARWDRRLAQLLTLFRPALTAQIDRQVEAAALPSPPTPFEVYRGVVRSARRSVQLLLRPPQIELRGKEYLQSALERPGPLLCCGLHHGGWELIPLALQQCGLSVIAPAAPQKLLSRSLSALRSQTAAHYFPPSQTLHRLRRPQPEQKRSEVMTLLIDQPGPATPTQTTVSLFGEPRRWWSAPLQLTAQLGGAILPFSVEWEESGPFGHPIEATTGELPSFRAIATLHPPLAGSKQEVAEESARWAEEQIRRRPTDWVWFYDGRPTP